MKKKDVWKECTIDFNFEVRYKMMGFNPGNLKSFTNLNSDVRLVKGLLQEYYRCLRTKLRKQKKTSEITQINNFQNEIISLNAYIEKITGKHLTFLDLQQKIGAQVKERVVLKKSRETHRTINYYLLFQKVAAAVFLGNKEIYKKFIIYLDSDKAENEVENIIWASQQEVSARSKDQSAMILSKFKNQFMPAKHIVKNSKLTEGNVLTIKARSKKGDRLRKLAKQLDEIHQQVYRTKTGEKWNQVRILEYIFKENKKEKWQAT